ncbi:MAG: response regulator, partial [Bacteroidota bacterium]
MRVLIIEDEMNAYEILSKRIKKVDPSIDIIGHLKSVIEGINWFQSEQEPDLLLLDVELADGQCFEIFKHISIQCPVIFTTAYDQYAIQAFALNSVDYLLKPISEQDLSIALERLKLKRKAFSVEGIQSFLGQLPAKKRSRFLLQSGERYFYIKAKEIAYCYAEDGLVFIKNYENRRFLINETLE